MTVMYGTVGDLKNLYLCCQACGRLDSRARRGAMGDEGLNEDIDF
jgi:hypothetical protein